MIQLRLAQAGEAELCMEILNQAKAYLHSYGNYQWDDTYPTLSLIEQDIANQKGYLIVDGDETLGYFCGDFDGEPAYDGIKGQWLSDQPYIVVHRLGLGDAGRDRKLTGKIFGLIEELAASRGIHSFRIDTDRRNLKMQHILPKNGFTFCGYIVFAGDDKLAYEKLL